MTERDEFTCERFDASLEAYADAELDAETAALFDAHRADCARCAGELAHAQSVSAAVRELPRLEAPSPVVAAVLAVARAEAGRSSLGSSLGRWSWLEALRARPALAALGTALLLAIALLVIVSRGSGPGPAGPALDDPAVIRATLETKLALAHFARANRRVGRGLSEDLLRDRVVRPAVRGLTESGAEPPRDGGSAESERSRGHELQG